GGPRWNNWARYPSFVAMMLDLEKYIAKRDRVLERRQVGEPIQLSLNPVEFLDQVEIISPETSNTPVTRLQAAPVTAESSQNQVSPDETGDEINAGESTRTAPENAIPAGDVRLNARFGETDAPGIYVVKLLDVNNSPVEQWITYNVPLNESELNLATTEQIRKELGDDLKIQIQEPGEVSWIAGHDAGQEIRNWLLLCLIVFFLAEQVLGYRLSFHSRGGTA
ncbi:MAG: hypothetical protein VB858_11050, partial [Planctomycetaceae bacterium]